MKAYTFAWALTVLFCFHAVANETLNSEEFKPIALEEAAPTAAPIAAQEPIANTQVSENAPASKQEVSVKSLKESEIPVLTQSAKTSSSAKSPWGRLIMSLFVVAIVGAVLFRSLKWWQKKAAVQTDTNKIRIVNQHYLGPRKSLAIIRVAGESILIGVTDHNISLIKSLSLLDGEDVSNDVPATFSSALQKSESMPQQEEEKAWSNIRDRVSTKIKEMRPL